MHLRRDASDIARSRRLMAGKQDRREGYLGDEEGQQHGVGYLASNEHTLSISGASAGRISINPAVHCRSS